MDNNNNSIDAQIQHAVATLKAGDLIAFPTETVYGLGADARNPTAIAKVFAAKARPTDHPLIVHIADEALLPQWAQAIPTAAKTLCHHFWPGPLTIILPKRPDVPYAVTGGQDTIAIRIPRHPITLELLRRFGGGIVGPSANTHCRISPTAAKHVQADLGDKVTFILDGGACEVGIESTIVSFVGENPCIVRHGNITASDIARVLGIDVTSMLGPESTSTAADTMLKTPGSMKLHYAPKRPLFLIPTINCSGFNNAAVLSFQPQPKDFLGFAWQQMPNDAEQYAKILYATLHVVDQPGVDAILVEQPPSTDLWAAVMDRLVRSSFRC